MARKSQTRDRGYGIFLVPGVLLFVLLVFAPFVANIALSFTRWSGVGVPVWIGLANYQKALGDAVFWASLRNNLALIVAITVIPTLIGLFLAAFLFDYVAVKIGKRTANVFRAGYYLPQIIPVVIASVVWRWMYQPDWGVINYVLRSIGLGALAQNWLGDASTAMASVMVVMIWFQIGYPLVIFMAGLQRIDPELYEAAALEGASWFQRFSRITVHLLLPEIYVVVLTTTIYALKVFGPIYVMTLGGPGTSTIVAAYFSFKNFFDRSQVGYGATIATVLTVLVLIITIFYVRIQSRQQAWENQ
ncbi:MAG: sugar ABC transporter permease [Anaerolineales bacterium]|nr:sugar ABC transporter permease [Anaerolineales bacterium]